jgi:hypothetical protein
MEKVLFMSHRHVDLLNDLFAKSTAMRAACAQLPRDVHLVHHLRDEEGGPDVWWQVSFTRADGSFMRLGPPSVAREAVVEAGYWWTVEQTQGMAGRTSEEAIAAAAKAAPPPPAVAEAMALIAEAHRIGWTEASTLPIEIVFPVRGQTAPPR